MDDRTEHSEDETERDREGRGLHSEDDPIAMLDAMQRQHETVQRQMIDVLAQRAEEVSHLAATDEAGTPFQTVYVEVRRFICPHCGSNEPCPNGAEGGDVTRCPTCQSRVRLEVDPERLAVAGPDLYTINETARRLLDF